MIDKIDEDYLSSYQAYLPAIFQQTPFVGRFLLAFERILSGLPFHDETDPLNQAGQAQLGLEQVLDQIHTYFNPLAYQDAEDKTVDQAPADFLAWLASWVALSLREDWDEVRKRRFISRIVSLYHWRGTKYGLQKMLETYTGELIKITEFDQPPHYFQVEMSLSETDPEILYHKETVAQAIINQEKPAHTFYALWTVFPAMQIRNDYDWTSDHKIGVWVGENTLLGSSTKE